MSNIYALDQQVAQGEPLPVPLRTSNTQETDIPTTPSDLKAYSDFSIVNLYWNDLADNEEGFEIERKVADSGYTLIFVAEANTTSYTDSIPEKGKAYFYRVRAINTSGKSGYSNEIKITPEDPINYPPIATFTIDRNTGFSPLKVKFDASASSDVDGKIIEFIWDFGDGNQGTGEFTTHVFETEGMHEVTLTVIDDRAKEGSISQVVTILPADEIQGNTYYVSSSEGDDNNTGTSADQAWRTLSKVNETAFIPGDTIFFKRGDIWTESLVVPVSGMPNADIYFTAYSQGDLPVFAPTYAAEAITIEGKSYISINDIHVRAEAHEKGIRIAGDAAFVTINSCMVEGNSGNTSTRGIEYSTISDGKYPTFPTITNCEVFNFQEGIGGYAGLHEGGNISGNSVHTTATDGTDLIRAISGDYEGLIIANNELTGWKDDAIDLYGGSNIIIEHNHIYSPSEVLSERSGIGIKAGGVGPPLSTGNIIRYNKIHHLTGVEDAIYDGINTNHGSHGQIYGNLIYAVQGNAIAVTSSHDYWRIYHNTLINAQKSGIYVGDNIFNIELINNIIDGKGYDVEVSGANAIVHGFYNLLINNQSELVKNIGGEGIYYSSTDIKSAEIQNFLFIDEEQEDFRLVENAAAIDAGMTLKNYDHDIHGDSIRHLPDLGAFEFQIEEIIVLTAPSDLQAEEGLDKKIELTWTDVNQDVQFVIERMSVYEDDFKGVDTVSLTSYADTSVQYGVTYFYRVRAINSFIASDYSNMISIQLSEPEIQENQPPFASFTMSANEGIAPLELMLNASASTDPDGTIVSYTWDFDDGTTGRGRQIIHVYSEPGNYTISLTITDNRDSSAVVARDITVILPENQLPLANAGEDQTITYPVDQLQLLGTGTDQDGEIVSFLWQQMDGPTQASIEEPTQASTEITELIPGEYLFQLTVTDDRGGIASDEVKVLVKPEIRENQLPVAFAGEDRMVTFPLDTIILIGTATDHDGDIVSYQWSYVGTNEIYIEGEYESTLIVGGLTPGVHQFQFMVTDNDGGSTTDEIKITVKGSLESVKPNKAFSPNGDGIDDLWVIENVEAIENCELKIFNRAGQPIFEAAPYHNNWDATFNNQPLPSADYYYIIRCNNDRIKSGGIRVLR